MILAYLQVYRKAREVSPGDDILAFKSKMKARIVLLGAIGSFPILGDLADAILMFNTQNAASLERLLLKRSGYFEVMAKEKALKKTRGHRNPSEHHSEVSLPPPKYETSHSDMSVPAAHHHPTSKGLSTQKAKNMLGWINNSSHSTLGPREGSATANAPLRPVRPEPIQGQGTNHHRGFF